MEPNDKDTRKSAEVGLPSDESKKADQDSEFRRLELIHDSGKWFVGLYSALAAGLGALIASNQYQGFQVYRPLMFAGIISIALGVFAGGVVVATIPHRNNLREFLECKTGPIFSVMEGKYWWNMQHIASWLGLFLAALAIAVGTGRLPAPR
jgi:hypothetical protein